MSSQSIIDCREASTLVWAKMKYCSFWPARVVQPPPELGKTPRRKICVFFFGSNNFGFVDIGNVKSYQQFRLKYVEKGRGSEFRLAVEKVDEFLRDPSTFHSNAKIKPQNKQITVKKEYDYYVKKEPDADQMFICEKIDFRGCTNTTAEKKSTEFIVKQEPRNSGMSTDGIYGAQSVDFAASNEIIQRKLKDMENEIDQLKLELTSMKTKHHREHLELKSKNRNLIRENKSMEARIKQLQTVGCTCGPMTSREVSNGKMVASKMTVMTEQNRDMNSISPDEEVYEVDKIVSHEIRRGKEVFLVRWKGYDASSDSWERKENLNCPKKLQEYFLKI